MRYILDWYNTLEKPFLNPPAWLFAPAWTILYLLMAVSLLLYLISPQKEVRGFVIFFVQLGLNLLWPSVFFGAQMIIPGAIICVLLTVLIFYNIKIFYCASKVSAYLLVPYFVWMCYATYLNIGLAILN